jgi:hypothetical protein
MPEHAKYPFFPDNVQFWYEAKRAFGASSYGSSEFGEVMATVNRIASGDNDSWHSEWNATAERVFAEAEAQYTSGHRISARDSYLRATTYFRVSEFFLHGNPNDPRIDSAYNKSIQAYKSCCVLYDPPILPVEIPYEDTMLPGYFHRVDELEIRRPLFVMHSGFDGSAEELHGEGACAGIERGYNVLSFDGPGQYGPIHRERLHFRPDWEKVAAPVVDFALTLPGVDPNKIARMGISLGGYLAPVPQLLRNASRRSSPTTEFTTTVPRTQAGPFLQNSAQLPKQAAFRGTYVPLNRPLEHRARWWFKKFYAIEGLHRARSSDVFFDC